MKTLYILRHGKSSWDNVGMSDYDRPLLKKGESRTLKVSKYLVKMKLKPDLIISSPAKRAKQTAKIIAKELNTPLVFDDNLYPGNSLSILDSVYSIDNEINSVIIVGHNPGLTTVVRELMDNDLDWLPTSGLAYGTWQTDKWTDISLSRPMEVKIILPKQIT
ncbi:MAG: histidine phosphatase family protein [Bacteroidales bacterium]|nr:histidine phosphatase family protein [Bacteroidales bacterium]